MEKRSLKSKVEAIVAQIPEGRVMTYGQLASLAGSPNSARIVGGIAHFGDSELPWHRVINKQGGLASGYPGGRKAHKERLEAEGIVMNGEVGNYCVDVEKLIWWPSGTLGSAISNELLAKNSQLTNINEAAIESSTVEYSLEDANRQSPIIFLVGPTASGKTNLAIKLAKTFDGEIVCADSQTLRKDLNIGTAKPTSDEMDGVVHHMLDIIEPYERFSVNQYKSMALEKIHDIQKRGKLPIIVGGSGLYIDSLFFDFELSESTENSEYKRELEKLSTRELQELIKEKKYPMPENEENPRHLIGMLLRGGVVNENRQPIEGAVIYGLLPDDETLKNRINSRVEAMFEDGFIDEVKSVIKKYGQPPQKLDAIGYLIGADYISGKLTLEQAKEKFKNEHWQYARRQKSWFKRNTFIQWFSSDEEAMNTIKKELETTLNKSVTM